MSLRPSEAVMLAPELATLAGGAVQKVYTPTGQRVYLELRVPGRSQLLLVCAENARARISAVDERPLSPATPPAWQHVLRKELVGARLAGARAVEGGRALSLLFNRQDRVLTLLVSLVPPHFIALLTSTQRVLALSAPPPPGLRVGLAFDSSELAGAKSDAPSRLEGKAAVLPLAHAAEALFHEQEEAGWKKAQRAPAEAKLKRLLRTIEKVKADADRAGKAQQYREEGELLTTALGRLERGETSITLDAWQPDGTVVKRTIALDPKRTPKQEVAWRFHQYKRLTRGAVVARERVAQLEKEVAAARAELEAAGEAPPTPQLPPTPARAQQEAAALPYRVYTGHGGRPIWVGRGAAHNDELTFHVAKPHHLWLHARGVTGAHVVVPLEKKESVPPELLIDAAHLALFHSDAKGETKAEVAWAPVKYVKKPKGGAPGAVTFTHEKTVLLRVEPERLEQLLATRADR